MFPKALGTTIVSAILVLTMPPARADEPNRPPAGRPCTVVAQWTPHLLETRDTRSGAPLRGLAGRVFLFPDDPARSKTISCKGELVVDLYDDSPLAMDGQSVRLERWVFPDEILKRLLRRDAAGWGYTLFLPWMNSYRPDITRIHLQVAFTPKGSGTLSETSPCIPLQHESRPLAAANAPQPPKSGPGAEVPANNRRAYYVISGRPGEMVVNRLPFTGNETVLDAVARVRDLPGDASRSEVWVARLSRGSDGNPQILPVDWAGISQRGEMRTNYVLQPGDRVYVMPRHPALPR
jgi:hypothetical protein